MSKVFGSIVSATAGGVVATGTTITRTLADRFAETFNVLNFGAKGDGTHDDYPAFAAALAAIYAAKGGVLVVPRSRSGGYVLGQPVVIDPSQYSGGTGITLELNGNTFLPSHQGWCFDFKTNYFGPNNGGQLGKKLVLVHGAGAVFIDHSSGAGAIRATDVVGFKIHDVVAYGYAAGWGVQLNVSTADASTWTEEAELQSIRASGCLVGMGTFAANANCSFLGLKIRHCVVEGRVNGCTLYHFDGGVWDALIQGAGGYYNQNGTTGGQGIFLNGSFCGTSFDSVWVDTGVDSSGNNPSSQSALSDIVFGSNYTTVSQWFPTFRTVGEINLPLGWRSKIICPDPFAFAGTATGQMSGNPREVLRNSRQYFVSTSGSDTANNGLSAASPFASIAQAVNVIYQTIDVASQGVTIQLADGTYTVPVAISGLPLGLGTASLTLSGDTAVPGAVTIVPSVGDGLTLSGGAKLTIQGITFGAPNGSAVVLSDQSSLTVGPGCQFATCAYHHLLLNNSAINIINSYKITGGVGTHVQLQNGARLYHVSGQIDATNITFSTNYCWVHDNSNYVVNGGAYVTTGSAGQRFYVQTGGVVNTGSKGPTFLPGSTNGIADASTYAVYN